MFPFLKVVMGSWPVCFIISASSDRSQRRRFNLYGHKENQVHIWFLFQGFFIFFPLSVSLITILFWWLYFIYSFLLTNSLENYMDRIKLLKMNVLTPLLFRYFALISILLCYSFSLYFYFPVFWFVVLRVHDIKKGLEELTKIIDDLGYKKNVSYLPICIYFAIVESM